MTTRTGSRAPTVDRRRFLSRIAQGGALVGAAPLLGATRALANGRAPAGPIEPGGAGDRAGAAYWLRSAAAASWLPDPSAPAHAVNGDESRYADLRASFFKTLPQNGFGEVEPDAYAALVAALKSGRVAAVERVPASPLSDRRLANPLAAHAYEMLGPDAWHTAMPAAPAFASRTQAAEMIEVYWQALTRDVPFRDYPQDRLVDAALRDLNGLPEPPGAAGTVTAATLFRGETPLDAVGPYVSQFLWLPADWGLARLDQRFRLPLPGQQFATTRAAWLALQRGEAPDAKTLYAPHRRHIANGRDLAEYVHGDVVYQAYLTAAVVMLDMGDGALDRGNPYRDTRRQGGFVTLGVADVVDLVAKAAATALKAAWYHKWLRHRRLRPEVFAARAQFQLGGERDYDVHYTLFDSLAAERLLATGGALFLPLAYPEGSPTHPSYPAGHAAVAGACATILKAFFDEAYEIPAPVEASADGLRLEPWTGTPLTLGGEINKLASNITLGRDAAGVHYRSDGIDGMTLGEEIGLGVLRDYAGCRPERFDGFSLTRFDGTPVQVGA